MKLSSHHHSCWLHNFTSILFLLHCCLVICTSTEPNVLADQLDYDDDLRNSSNSAQEAEDDLFNAPPSSEDCQSTSMLAKLTSIHAANRHLPLTKHVAHLNGTMQIIDHLVKLTTSLIATELNAEQMGIIMESFYTANISDNCFLALAHVAKGILEQRIWALKFVDSLGKIPTGIAEGAIAHFGEFDECLEIENKDTNVRGQYCLAKFILPYPKIQTLEANTPLFGYQHYQFLVRFLAEYNLDNYLTLDKFIELLNNQKGATFRLGICFPSACSPTEFEGLINQVLYPITKMPVELQPDCFNSEDVHQFDKFELASISIIAILLFINIFCTIINCLFQSNNRRPTKEGDNGRHDLPHRSARRWLYQIVKCFSLVHNTRALFDLTSNESDHCGNCRSKDSKVCAQCCVQCHQPRPQPTSGARRFAFLDAIRLILVINVCIDHMFLFSPFMSYVAFKRILTSVFITKVYYYNKYFFARNILIVDALFIISGLVLSYSLLRKLTLSRGRRLDYGIFVVRLWLKYSLPMGTVMLLFWILPLTGDGPIWNMGMHLLVPACKDSFSIFSSFAYFSNYRIKATHNVFNFDPQFAVCNPPTWFLSALFQLQILGPFFVYLIYRNPKYGLIINGFIILLGSYAAVSPTHFGQQHTYLEGLKISSLEEMVKAFVAFHMGINQYIMSFFVGITVGYFVSFQLAYRRFQLSKRTKVVFWSVSAVALSAIMFWFNTLHVINQAAPRMSILLWFSIGKLIACLAIGWMLFALCVGRAVVVERIFSLGFFRIMSRLSFGIYLLHFIPLTHRLFTVRDTYFMTDKLLFEYIVIDFLQTTFMAAIFHIAIERPFNALISLLFSKSEFGKESAPSQVSDIAGAPSSGRLPDTGTNPAVSCSPINHHQIKSSLPSVNLFAANCHEVYLVSTKP